MKKIVTIGGGTGTSALISGLKKRDFEITALASMADSGGSNKIIRDEFGLLPTSDIRQYIVALAEEGNDSPQNLMRKLFMYRFRKGGEGIKRMTFGNLFMAALADILGDQTEAIQKTADILKIKGKIIPITSSNSHLMAIYENGLKVKDEHNIDEPKHNGKLRIKRIYLDPPSMANPQAVEAIRKANLIIVGPGDLYTSLAVNLVVDGIAEAVKNARAKIVYVLNLMTSFGETYGFKASDHIRVIEEYLSGRKIDCVLVNSAELPEDILEKYRKENDFPVKDDLAKDDKHRIIRADLLSWDTPQKDEADILKRSLIRHNGEKIAKIISSLYD